MGVLNLKRYIGTHTSDYIHIPTYMYVCVVYVAIIPNSAMNFITKYITLQFLCVECKIERGPLEKSLNDRFFFTTCNKPFYLSSTSRLNVLIFPVIYLLNTE